MLSLLRCGQLLNLLREEPALLPTNLANNWQGR